MKRVFNVKGKFSIWPLLAALVISLGTGGLSSVFTRESFTAYQALEQPVFAPPGWIFAPVWTILFILMGIASYRIFMLGWKHKEVRSALGVYLLQLIFNFLWTIIFFRWELRGFALAEILMLLALIVINTRQFFKLDCLAGYFMVPYVLWVSFASILNYSVWMLNK